MDESERYGAILAEKVLVVENERTQQRIVDEFDKVTKKREN